MADASLTDLVERAAGGDLTAFDEIVLRFQDMAVGYAHSILGDFHLAEDASQAAFLQAFESIGQVAEPAAFPGWFRRVVFTQCTRLTRSRPADTVSIERVPDPEDGGPGPDGELLDREKRALVWAAVADLRRRSVRPSPSSTSVGTRTGRSPSSWRSPSPP